MTVQNITTAILAILAFAIGFTTARIFGCGQCRATRDQELTVIKRLLGDQLEPVTRHKIRRHRPFTAGEVLDLLNYNKVLLTPARWQELEDQRRAWNAAPFRPGREPLAVEAQPSGAHTRAGAS